MSRSERLRTLDGLSTLWSKSGQRFLEISFLLYFCHTNCFVSEFEIWLKIGITNKASSDAKAVAVVHTPNVLQVMMLFQERDCEFGDAGNDTSCERQFNLDHRKCEDYRGTRFYNKDSALVIKW